MERKSLRLYKIGLIVLAVLMIAVFAFGQAVYGEGEFELEDSYPKDGANNAAVENLGVKLTFTQPVDGEAQFKEHPEYFSFTGPNGKLPIKVYNNPKDECQILVLYDITTGGQLTAKNSDTYSVKISGKLESRDGQALGTDHTITFDTINQARSTRIYMVMMLLMMAGMAAFTMIQTNKKMKEEAVESGKEETFNPYKEAKRTGKSVEEVIKEHEKEVAKQKAKEAKKARIYDLEEEEEEEEEENGNYKVKGPRPISAGGSIFVTGRKALAEAKKAEEEKAKQQRNKKKK